MPGGKQAVLNKASRDKEKEDELEAFVYNFLRSTNQKCSLPISGMSKQTRETINNVIWKYGLRSKVVGARKAERTIQLFKPPGTSFTDLHFNRHSKAAMESYLQRHPPTVSERSVALLGMPIWSKDAPPKPKTRQELKQRAGKAVKTTPPGEPDIAGTLDEGAESDEDSMEEEDSRSAPTSRRRSAVIPSHPVAASYVKRAQETATRFLQDSRRGQIVAATRESLPIASFRDEIVSTLESHQVLVIAGETGCGKTTQVPQFVLEAAAAAGRPCRVLCSQPRRISATSVAQRVAQERAQVLGEGVGYSIRFETMAGPNTALMFMTTGVLLKALADPESLAGVTHIVVDEVHERDRNSDFALILLKELLPTRPDLRVVLMSATAQLDLFSGYFGNCPILKVPGFTHEVEDVYLDDILHFLGPSPRELERVQRQKQYLKERAAEMKKRKGKNKRKRKIENPFEDPDVMVAMVAEPSPEQTVINAKAKRVQMLTERAFHENTDEAFRDLVTAALSHEMQETGDTPLIDVHHPMTGVTPLMAAAACGRKDVVELLIRLNVDAWATGLDLLDAPKLAKAFGHKEVADMIVAHTNSKGNVKRRERVEKRKARAGFPEMWVPHDVHTESKMYQHYGEVSSEQVNVEFIERLLAYLFAVGKFSVIGGGPIDGDVLVFLPGWEDISKLSKRLNNNPDFPSDRFSILALHSQIAAEEQKLVFRDTPDRAKIILATNVAETSITIDGIIAVINSGRTKEKSHDAVSGVSRLQSTWISKANERQRRGRAGRTRPGVAFHLYPEIHSKEFDDHQLPEIQRCPLDEICLVARQMDPERSTKLGEFLKRAPQPPSNKAVSSAIGRLQEIGAMAENEALTPLGQHLAALPLPPQLGNLIIYGILFKCLDPILTVAAAMSYRSPWVMPMGQDARSRQQAIKDRLAQVAPDGSDHLLLIHCYNQWAACGTREQRDYAMKNFLSSGTMYTLKRLRRQVFSRLQQLGLIGPGTTLQSLSANARETGIVRCALAAGLYPMVGIVDRTDHEQKRRNTLNLRTPKREAVAAVKATSTVTDEDPEHTFGEASAPAHLVAYDEVTEGDNNTLSVQATTLVPSHPLVLVGCRLRESGAWSDNSDNDFGNSGLEGTQEPVLAVVDRWLYFHTGDPETREAVAILRLRLRAALEWWCKNPGRRLPPYLAAALDTITTVFAEEGMTLKELDPVRFYGKVEEEEERKMEENAKLAQRANELQERGVLVDVETGKDITSLEDRMAVIRRSDERNEQRKRGKELQPSMSSPGDGKRRAKRRKGHSPGDELLQQFVWKQESTREGVVKPYALRPSLPRVVGLRGPRVVKGLF